MKTFFPSHISHCIQLLEKYYEFTDSIDSTNIEVIYIVLERIENLRQEFISLLKREDLTEPDQLIRNIRSFQTLLMKMEEIESFGLPIVTHYQPQFDGYLTVQMKQLCLEIASPVESPHVSALSTGTLGYTRDYYWYHGYFDTIFVPAAERFSLLNLPDLLHELGHHLLKIYNNSFLDPFVEWISKYRKELENAILQGDICSPDNIAEARQVYSEYWLYSWQDELVCDLIAIYCAGKAYAWTNVKICQSNYPGTSLYSYTDSHPANAYRMDAILAMMEHLGLDKEDVRKTWTEYSTFFKNDRYFLYEYLFPSGLIGKMANHVYETCNDIGLISCIENLKKENTLVNKFNRVWANFRGI